MFGIITLVTALLLASTAASFAIFGIVAIFAAAPIAALVMGIAIEAGKVVGVSWLYRNWKEPTNLRYVLLPLVIVAMILTSLGIFGFLSKAHLEQNAPSTNNELRIERLDQRIQREEEKIEDAETVIAQLDDTVQTLIEYDRISGPDGARAVREGQQEQRDLLAQQIEDAEDQIDEYRNEKLELRQELRQLELELGPIKYIAEIVFENPESRFDDAVRFVIIAFIFVFDPMAIILLMAANYTIMRDSKEGPKSPSNTTPTDQGPGDDPEPESSSSTNNKNERFSEKDVDQSKPSTTPMPSRPGKFVGNDRAGRKFQSIKAGGDSNVE